MKSRKRRMLPQNDCPGWLTARRSDGKRGIWHWQNTCQNCSHY